MKSCAADQIERGLVRVVQALAADRAVQVGDLLDRSLRGRFDRFAAHAPGQGLLCGFEFRGGIAGVTGVGDVFAVGRGEERGDTHVDTDHGPGRGERIGLGLLGSQDDVPALALRASR